MKLFWFKHGHLPASDIDLSPHLFCRSRRLYSCRIRDGAKCCSLVGRCFAVNIFPFRLLQCLVVVVRIVWHVLIDWYGRPSQSKCVRHVATQRIRRRFDARKNYSQISYKMISTRRSRLRLHSSTQCTRVAKVV